MMDPEIPKNEGFFDSIELIVPPGCVLNPPPGKPVRPAPTTPAPTSARSSPWPCRRCCPTGRAPDLQDRHPHHHPGVDPRTGQPFTDHSAEVYAGWCSAAKGMDAWGCQAAAFGNLWKATAEINESLFPHVQWGRDYRTDSGGAGQWRGLCGSHYRKEVRVPTQVYTYVVGMKYPMPGIAGGGPGEPNRLVLRADSDDPFVVQPHRRLGPARGGRASSVRLRRRWRLGRPARPRPPEPCSTTCSTSTSAIEGAERDYGVVLTARSTTSRWTSTRRPPTSSARAAPG